jgi:hypothetical protein
MISYSKAIERLNLSLLRNSKRLPKLSRLHHLNRSRDNWRDLALVIRKRAKKSNSMNRPANGSSFNNADADACSASWL